MSKNVLIFCDGTGQAGGLRPDEARTNVYKLFRATRCGPDTNIDPQRQVAFYDPGIGSEADNGSIKIGWLRYFVNVLCQMTGLGISRNIIDGYAAIIDLWEPGDRIFLFGFSRGAYTARCIGGVLRLCGVPTKDSNGRPLASPKLIRRIARQAVKSVYQHGASKAAKRFELQRDDLAATFRRKYGSDDHGQSNEVPYFIGVWDTVAALGTSIPRLILSYLIAIIAAGVVFSLISWAANLVVAGILFGIGCSVLMLSYLWTHVKWAFGTRDPIYKTVHVVAWRLRFYDQSLCDRVRFARHAISIDERRKDFPRVPWRHADSKHAEQNDGINWFEQIWFAGNHGDIGGGYSENESRLSDIALKWMVDEARRVPNPIIVNESYLQLFPSSAGVMHDECKSGIIPWFQKPREIPNGAYLHETVFERLSLREVRNYDSITKYDPSTLKKGTFNCYKPLPPNSGA